MHTVFTGEHSTQGSKLSESRHSRERNKSEMGRLKKASMLATFDRLSSLGGAMYKL